MSHLIRYLFRMIFLLSGFSTFIAPVDMDYLTVFHRHNVGASGTVFVAISSTNDAEGQVGGRVGIGSTQPIDDLFQVGNNTFIVTDVNTVGIATTQPAQRFQINSGTQFSCSNWCWNFRCWYCKSW